LTPPAALDERLVYDHVFTAAVLDEKHQVRQAIEQRLAVEGFGQLRKKLGS